MHRLLPALVLALVLLPGCKRGRMAQTNTKEPPPNTPVARQQPPARNENPGPPGPGFAPGPVAGNPPPAATPGAPSWHGGDRPANTTSRGTATIGVDGTPLNDFILYGLTIDNGAFRVDGQGIALVGRMSRDWAGSIGKPIAVASEIAGIGKSELDLPMIGVMKVVAGQLVIDQVVSKSPPRVKGRLLFQLQGPDGRSSFTGTFEVGIVVK